MTIPSHRDESEWSSGLARPTTMQRIMIIASMDLSRFPRGILCTETPYSILSCLFLFRFRILLLSLHIDWGLVDPKQNYGVTRAIIRC